MTAIPEAARTRILADLARIERDKDVRILFAVESGSRAWGFPSPDSDYDARFVYARSADWYLSLAPGRDVIELPIDGDFDVNGWDIRKALQLLLKPNPVLLEWLSSPIRYSWNETLCTRLSEVATRTAYAEACIHHYYGLARRLGREHLEGRDQVNLKKYFYVVRPALCLLWVRERKGDIPPMSLPDLMRELPLSAAFKESIEELLARKATSSEVGEGPRIAALDAVITDQMAWVESLSSGAREPDEVLRREADDLFRDIVKGAL